MLRLIHLLNKLRVLLLNEEKLYWRIWLTTKRKERSSSKGVFFSGSQHPILLSNDRNFLLFSSTSFIWKVYSPRSASYEKFLILFVLKIFKLFNSSVRTMKQPGEFIFDNFVCCKFRQYRSIFHWYPFLCTYLQNNNLCNLCMAVSFGAFLLTHYIHPIPCFSTYCILGFDIKNCLDDWQVYFLFW